MQRLALAFVLTAIVAVVEFWGGTRAHSLALVTDAAHVCMDVFALGLALLTTIGARRPADRRRTFGYGRLEMLGALANGAILLAVTIVIVFEAVHRFVVPQLPAGGLMTAIAAMGLAVNASVGSLLRRHAHGDVNVRVALFHVAGDALGAAAVIVGGAVIWLTGAAWIDPLLSLFVAAIIVVGVVHVLRDATEVLLESVPRGVDTQDVRATLERLSGVVAVHDLHVWTIGSGAHALSAHVLLDDRRISEATAVLRAIDALLRERYDISHTTVQFECENCGADDRIVCTQRE